MTDTNTEDNRDQISFVSVDSAPKRFAGPVSQMRAPAMLLAFCVIATFFLWLVNTPFVSTYFPNRDFVLSPYEGRHAVAVRIFIFSFFISFAAFSSGGGVARLLYALDMVFSYALICALLDLANITLSSFFDIGYSLHFSAIISGLLGFAVYSFKLLERGRMPDRIPIEHRPVSNRKAVARLLITMMIAIMVSYYVSSLDLQIVSQMRDLTLLGGIGPGVFLFLPTLFGQLYALAIIDVALAKRANFKPAVCLNGDDGIQCKPKGHQDVQFTASH